jgi:hypothetical protein
MGDAKDTLAWWARVLKSGRLGLMLTLAVSLGLPLSLASLSSAYAATQAVVTITSPANNLLTNQTSVAVAFGATYPSGVDCKNQSNHPKYAYTIKNSGGTTVVNVASTAFPNNGTGTCNFSGSQTLAEGTYTLTVTAISDSDTAGNSTVTFTVDTTAPTVTSVSPANGATNVAKTTTVTATFSEAVNTTTVKSTTFTLVQQGGGSVAGTVTCTTPSPSACTTATFTPSAQLVSGSFTATIVGGSAGVKDPAGNPVATNFTWSFSTAGLPTVPLNASATAGIRQATVSWDPPSSPNGTIDQYRVTIVGAGTQFTTTAATACTGSVSPTCSYVVTGLTAGATYSFTVEAHNATGYGPTATTNSVTLANVPGQPSSVSVLPSNASAAVSWTAPTSNGGSAITNYSVKVYLSSNLSTPVATQTYSAGSVCATAPCSATVTSLTNGSTYQFIVYATNAVGNGPDSAISGAVVPTAISCGVSGLAICGGAPSSFATTINGLTQTLYTSQSAFQVQDPSASSWHVTVQGTQFTCTGSAFCPGSDSLPVGSFKMAGPSGQCDGTGTLTVQMGSATSIDDGVSHNVASYSGGVGSCTFAAGSLDGNSSHNLSVSVKSTAFATTYRSTVTLTVATGP